MNSVVSAKRGRNLAGRSAAAAKEIKSLIRDIVKKVADVSALADASGQALEYTMAAGVTYNVEKYNTDPDTPEPGRLRRAA